MVLKTQLSFICYAVIQISNYNYMFRPYIVTNIKLNILSFKTIEQNIEITYTLRLELY